MPFRENPDLLTILVVLIVSAISGFVSVAQRIAKGHKATLLWVTSEFMAALLCGYLMYDLFQFIEHLLPAWLTMPICVAFAAHVGGRSFQEFEAFLYRRYPKIFKPPPPPF